MQIELEREQLLSSLQTVIGVVEKKLTFPVLSNVFFKAEGRCVKLITTDLEVELQGQLTLQNDIPFFEITIPAKKFFDIVKSLPEGTLLRLNFSDTKLEIVASKSRFTLSTLSAADFPRFDEEVASTEFSVAQNQLKQLLSQTYFAMAHEDVRYFLNGMLLELKDNVLTAVATDGHRLALATMKTEAMFNDPIEVIVPRKGIIELMRLLEDADERISITLSNTFFRVALPNLTFTSKLIDGKFPKYQGVIPSGGDKTMAAEREPLRQALQRAAILSNEKLKSVRFCLTQGTLTIYANNPEREEAEVSMDVAYDGRDIEIGFNTNYLLDILSSLKGKQVNFLLSEPSSSVLVEGDEKKDANSLYVVMPMCL